MNTTATAKLIRDNLPGFTGHAALFRCDPPIADYEPYGEGEKQQHHEYVIASATSVLGGPETYLFPADESGTIASWGELPGSQKGTLSHDAVFGDLGYSVVRASE